MKLRKLASNLNSLSFSSTYSHSSPSIICSPKIKSIFLILSIQLLFVLNINAERIEILMSNVTTQQEDAYICTSYKLEDDQSFITNIQPLATADIAHHMFAYGCEKPAMAANSWNCASNVCNGQKTILFAWGRNAPALQLPEDVAFKVGPNTNFKYIVVNIHYLKKISNDRSGLAITVSDKARRYQAGIMLMVANYIGIPPNTKKYSTRFSCKYTGKTLKVFAYRVHAHVHGDVNAAYKVDNHEWTQLALGDPQWPQAFYPTDSLIEIKDGSALVGMCTYHNDENRYVYAGSTHTDEMCNVYLMYYADKTDDVMDVCDGNTYPQLESVIPSEAEVKPAPPASFNINPDSSKKDAMSHHDMEVTKYTNVENWYDSKETNFGQIGGVAINQKNENILIFHRGSQMWQSDSFNEEYRFNTRKYSVIKENTVLVLNRLTGKIIDSWGADLFYMPHGLKLDSDGNVWITDVGRHQVLKFALNNTKEAILVVGEAMVPGNDRKHFCQPADIAILKSGEFFVADGYCNSRIVKFSNTGEYLVEWSSEDEGMPSHFFIPHSLALHETQNVICVADRENYRVQCFDLNGNYIHETSSADFGPIYGVSFAANNASVLYAVNGYNSRLEAQYDKKIFLISVKTGSLIGSINLNENAKTPHALALSDDASEIYVANLNPPVVFKYILQNFNLAASLENKRKSNNTKNPVVKLDNIDGDKDNFRTSMFIMAFLAIPLVLVILAALILRCKNTGKLRKLNLVGIGSNGIDSKHNELGKWIRNTTSSKKRNGFTRLNQESDGEEAERLNKHGSVSSNGGPGPNANTDSDTEDEITLPTLSKA